MELDLMESVRSRLERAGMENLYFRLADAAKHDEFTVVTFSVPRMPEVFFDMSTENTARVTIVCLRRGDLQAMLDAEKAFDALTGDPPVSGNGSYELSGMEITRPAPITWDESGRLGWAIDLTLEFKRKDG